MSCWIVSENHIRAIVTAYLAILSEPARCTTHEDCLKHPLLAESCAAETLKRANAVLERKLPDADQLGQMLWEENHRSWNDRYRETDETPPYKHEAFVLPLTLKGVPIDLYKTVSCYRYQSCEHAGWEASEAARIANLIEEWCEARGASSKHPGWDNAPWGIR